MKSPYFIILIVVFVQFFVVGQSNPPKCDHEQVPVNGQCQEVECDSDDQCSKFQSYCTKYKFGDAYCRARATCRCKSFNIQQTKNDDELCNGKLNGSDKCPGNQVCFPDGKCGPPPGCAFFGKSCHPTNNKCCDNGVYCHQRLGMSSFNCVRTAFVKESCKGGIPCESGSDCINDKRSLREGDACNFKGAVCSYKTTCRNSALSQYANKICA